MSAEFVTFQVFGHPEPAGSKRAVPTRDNWRTVPGVRWKVLDANVNAERWKRLVAQVAAGKMLQLRMKPYEGPIWVQMVFGRPRPQGHILNSGALSAEGNRHPFPASKPDLLKLARGVEDAMTGIVYLDDARIVTEVLRKEWGMEGVTVTVMPL